MTKLRLLIVFAAIGMTACITSSEESGRASPVVAAVVASGDLPAVDSLAGTGLSPFTCEGALAQPGPGFTLDTRSPIESSNDESSYIVSACTASYQSIEQGGAFLTVGLFTVTDEPSARSHFELVRGGYAVSGLAYQDVESGVRDLILSEPDREGIGRIIALRDGIAIVSIHSGPSLAAASDWPYAVMLATANDLASRLNSQQ